MIVQFFTLTGRILRGDLGRSIFSDMEVTTLLRMRAELTITSAPVFLAIAVVVTLPSMLVMRSFKAPGQRVLEASMLPERVDCTARRVSS